MRKIVNEHGRDVGDVDNYDVVDVYVIVVEGAVRANKCKGVVVGVGVLQLIDSLIRMRWCRRCN
jgi:hypothetical protein